jgi:quinol monooxygenase YgiN
MRKILGLLAVALIGIGSFAVAQQRGQAGTRYVVTSIEVQPNFAAEAGQLLDQFAADTRKDPGCVRIDVMRDVARPNRLAFVAVWKSQTTFDAHAVIGHTQGFRGQIQRMLSAPMDERIYTALQ